MSHQGKVGPENIFFGWFWPVAPSVQLYFNWKEPIDICDLLHRGNHHEMVRSKTTTLGWVWPFVPQIQADFLIPYKESFVAYLVIVTFIFLMYFFHFYQFTSGPFIYEFFFTILRYPAGIYLFKVNNRSARTRFETSSKLTVKTPKLHQ